MSACRLHWARVWRKAVRLGPLLALACIAASPLKADPVADFYAGKNIDLYIGFAPGGTYDLYARLVAAHMSRHIPGQPRIVARTMLGGGSRKAAQFVYGVAPKDGTALATADQALAVVQAQGEALPFDVARFNWVGSPISVNSVTSVWHTTGVKTIEDIKVREVTVGASGSGQSSQFPKVMNALVGTKFKIISGYQGGGPDINLAMERGEVEGRGSTDWISWKATKPEWLKEKKIIIVVQIGLRKESDLPDVPLMLDLVKTDEDRAVMRLMSSGIGMGRPLFTSPDVPAERLAALRNAFDATMRDPEFLADAAKRKFDIAPIRGVELQAQVRDVLATPRSAAERLAKIVGSPR